MLGKLGRCLSMAGSKLQVMLGCMCGSGGLRVSDPDDEDGVQPDAWLNSPAAAVPALSDGSSAASSLAAATDAAPISATARSSLQASSSGSFSSSSGSVQLFVTITDGASVSDVAACSIIQPPPDCCQASGEDEGGCQPENNQTPAQACDDNGCCQDATTTITVRTSSTSSADAGSCLLLSPRRTTVSPPATPARSSADDLPLLAAAPAAEAMSDTDDDNASVAAKAAGSEAIGAGTAMIQQDQEPEQPCFCVVTAAAPGAAASSSSSSKLARQSDSRSSSPVCIASVSDEQLRLVNSFVTPLAAELQQAQPELLLAATRAGSRLRLLGCGASGRVSLCRMPVPAAAKVAGCPADSCLVVVKSINHGVVMGADGELAYDNSEVCAEVANCAFTAGCPHFPQLLGCVTEQDKSHLLFECRSLTTVTASQLVQQLAEQGVAFLPRRLILSIAGTMAAALQHLHQQGVLHNDIKPENFVVVLRGSLLELLVAEGVEGYVIDVGSFVPDGASLADIGRLTGTAEFQHPQLLAHAADLGCCHARCHELSALGQTLLFLAAMGQQQRYMQLRQRLLDAYDTAAGCFSRQGLKALRAEIACLPGDGPVGADDSSCLNDGLVDLLMSLLGNRQQQPGSFEELQAAIELAAGY